MKKCVEKLINIAEGEKGYHEKASNSQLDDKYANSGNKNWQKYGRDLYEAGYYNDRNKNGYEWCDQYVDWDFLQLCGNRELAEKVECQTGPYGAGCDWSARYYRNQGRLSYSNPEPGDQIFFGDYDHTGLITKVEDGKIYTIEGNASNRVEERVYNINDKFVTSFGKPRFDLIPEYNIPFKDVYEENWFYDAIKWAYNNCIVYGKNDDVFLPFAPCNRGDFISFLWRYADRPKSNQKIHFQDVTEEYFAEPVKWGVENKIVYGYNKNTFKPYNLCTRGQAISMIWRFMGRPKPNSEKMSFKDVKKNKYYYNAILWAYQNNIAVGRTETEFKPDEPCTRAEVVGFLYKMNMI